MELSEIYELYLKHKAVTTDSRDCPEGSIFFALRGDNFDGNAYASKALEQGCAYAVVDEEQYAVKGDPRYILVKNSLDTMQQLAHLHRVSIVVQIKFLVFTSAKLLFNETHKRVCQKAETGGKPHTANNYYRQNISHKNYLPKQRNTLSLSKKGCEAINFLYFVKCIN